MYILLSNGRGDFMTEYWDLYDACGLPTGETYARSGELPEGKYHLVVHIWPVNKKGAFLVQQRKQTLTWRPGIWAATGGSALAGEDAFSACKREAAEELGLVVTRENAELFMVQKRTNSFCYIYVVYTDVSTEQLLLQESEVEQAAWVSAEKLQERMEQGSFHSYEYFSELVRYVQTKQQKNVLIEDCLIDLHLHLDGSLSIASARQLAALQKIDIPKRDEELRTLLSVEDDCPDLNVYLEKFAFPCMLLQTKEAISFAVENLLQELHEQGLMYAEIRFAPQKHTDKGLSQNDVIKAALDGMRDAPIPAGLILCCMRGDDTEEQNLETVCLAKQYLGQGVVAVDLAGAEALFSTEKFASVFAMAKELCVPYTIHAGEAAGPQSIRTALDFGAIRIGHGVRVTEDVALMERIVKEGITLECCPTSNLQTQVYANISEYPIRTFLEAGVKFTINTDNTAVSATSLRAEWEKVITAFSLTKEEVKQILLYSVDAAFADDALKEQMRNKVMRRYEKQK